jgi:hypothetical protein
MLLARFGCQAVAGTCAQQQRQAAGRQGGGRVVTCVSWEPHVHNLLNLGLVPAVGLRKRISPALAGGGGQW